MLDETILIFMIGQLMYIMYKIGKIEAKLKAIETLINNCVTKKTG